MEIEFVLSPGSFELFLTVFFFSWGALFLASRKKERTPWHMPLIATTLTLLQTLIHELGHAMVLDAVGYPVRSIGLDAIGGYTEVLLPIDRLMNPQLNVAGYLAGPISTLLFGYVMVGILYLSKFMSLRYPQRISGYVVFITLLKAIGNLLPMYAIRDGSKAWAITGAALREDWLLTASSWGTVIAFSIGLLILYIYALDIKAYMKDYLEVKENRIER